jgi:hypothetical protein
LLLPLEVILTLRFANTECPLIFIVGTPRSGTTLLYQLLARHLDVAYVDNAVARLWMAPLLAMVIFRRGQGDTLPKFPFHSNLGATPGPEAPHEFSYFWLYWLDDREADVLSKAEQLQTPWSSIGRELYGIAGYRRRPLLLKNLNAVDYNISVMAEHFPNIRFLWVRRDPVFVIQSILEARRQRYGDESTWWSVRPAGWRQWDALDPLRQIHHQVVDLEAAIEAALAEQPTERWREIRYESLVESPSGYVDQIASWLGVNSRGLDALIDAPLHTTNNIRIAPETFRRIEELVSHG